MKEITYADAKTWETWQNGYRFGAFYIFPPDGVIEHIDALRAQFDPKSSSYCQAHISLSEPLPQPLTEQQLKELQNALAAVKPFDIHYGPLRSFPPYPGAVYTITPEDAFMELRATVHATSLFADRERKRDHIVPHMTIAEFISIERTDELLQELSGKVPEGNFPCRSIEYAVPNRDFYFERAVTLPIGEKPS